MTKIKYNGKRPPVDLEFAVIDVLMPLNCSAIHESGAINPIFIGTMDECNEWVMSHAKSNLYTPKHFFLVDFESWHKWKDIQRRDKEKAREFEDVIWSVHCRVAESMNKPKKQKGKGAKT